jgi:hypothetical protein
MKLRQYDDVLVVEPDDPEELVPLTPHDAKATEEQINAVIDAIRGITPERGNARWVARWIV